MLKHTRSGFSYFPSSSRLSGCSCVLKSLDSKADNAYRPDAVLDKQLTVPGVPKNLVNFGLHNLTLMNGF